MSGTEIDQLASLSLEELRACWKLRWGVTPELRSKTLLMGLIAWRIQAEIHGGLSEQAVRRIRGTSIPRPALPIGTKLAREYRGVVHEVEIVTGGVSYAGHTYRSLTHVAGIITGTHWNGHAFFGLRKRS